MEKHFYVTTPIYYVNDIPHIGHAYTSLAADMVARFARLRKQQVKFLTGTDEHGQKVEKAALKANQSPQAFVNTVSQRFREMSTTLQLTNDDFIRTTEERHIKAVQCLWKTLAEKGHIYKDIYAGWYAVRDEAFYQTNDLVDGRAPTGAPVTWVEEESYFFRLSTWKQPLLDYYQNHVDFIGPPERRNEVISFVSSNLKDLSISRCSFKWGVPVPGDAQHVIYVWLDALTNYITALGYPTHLDTHYLEQALHLVGKDIIRFHCVYWPAFLMAAGLPVPKRIFAHGWLIQKGEKMSKSLGNVIDPWTLIDTFGLDQVRYFLLREVPFGQDGVIHMDALIQRINSDLANDLGNLVQRVLMFIQQYGHAKVPLQHQLNPEDQTILCAWKEKLTQMEKFFYTQELHRMCQEVWHLIKHANQYMDQQKPWTLRKTDHKRMATVLFVLAEIIRHIGILAQPIVPIGAAKILDLLNISKEERMFDALIQHPLTPGAPLPTPQPIFPRYDTRHTPG